MKVYRTHNCNELTVKDVDKKVTLSGWVHRNKRSWWRIIY